jgi:hypothetical protein
MDIWHSCKYRLKLQFLPHTKHSVAITKTNQSMLIRQIMTTDCQNYTERINTLCG